MSNHEASLFLQKTPSNIPVTTDLVAEKVKQIAMHVFSQFGPGMPKSVYQLAMCKQLRQHGVALQTSPVGGDYVMVEDCLLLNCVVDTASPVSQTQYQLDLLGSHCVAALVIEFGRHCSIHCIQGLEKSSRYH